MNLQFDHPRVLEISRAVRAAGGRAYLVGGLVRDRLLGANGEARDYDLEVFGLDGAALRQLLTRFGRVNAVGEAFTVYKIGDIDVSIPRRDSKTGSGHKGFTVTGDPAMSVEEAARRRDFTINAILCDPLTGEVLDPYGGLEDMKAKRLRAVDPTTFVEDSLRVLRGMQFAARFEFEIDAATVALCRSIPLDDLPSERIWGTAAAVTASVLAGAHIVRVHDVREMVDVVRVADAIAGHAAGT
jgi:tRNA nucleotidyltransferase (CCA-adding enzyme)